MNQKIAIVVPTVREHGMPNFCRNWSCLISKHHAHLIIVYDGDLPHIEVTLFGQKPFDVSLNDIMKVSGFDFSNIIFNWTDACRNLGFAYISRFLQDVDVILTLDDDVQPVSDDCDVITEHLNLLGQRAPISWISTTGWGVPYMRGFPYSIRQEAEIVMSHGVWTNIPDLDAQTQLAHPELVGGFTGPYYFGPIPKGVYAPISGMNIAFMRKALKYMYWAPMGPRAFGFHRWADILMGITAKREFDEKNWAIFTGAAKVFHNRKSKVLDNLELEATAIKLGERYWRESLEAPPTAYSEMYFSARSAWKEYVKRTDLMDENKY